MAARMRCTVPWRLVKVPSTSAQSAIGSATWAALTSASLRQAATINVSTLSMGSAAAPPLPSTPSSPTTNSAVRAPAFRSFDRS